MNKVWYFTEKAIQSPARTEKNTQTQKSRSGHCLMCMQIKLAHENVSSRKEMIDF